MYYSYTFLNRQLLEPKTAKFHVKCKGCCRIKYITHWLWFKRMDLQSGSTITIGTLTYEVFHWKKIIYFYNVYIYLYLVQISTFPTVRNIIYFYNRKKNNPMRSIYDFHHCKVCIQSMKLYKTDKHLWSARNQRELLAQYKSIPIHRIHLKIVFETHFKRARGARSISTAIFK